MERVLSGNGESPNSEDDVSDSLPPKFPTNEQIDSFSTRTLKKRSKALLLNDTEHDPSNQA